MKKLYVTFILFLIVCLLYGCTEPALDGSPASSQGLPASSNLTDDSSADEQDIPDNEISDQDTPEEPDVEADTSLPPIQTEEIDFLTFSPDFIEPADTNRPIRTGVHDGIELFYYSLDELHQAMIDSWKPVDYSTEQGYLASINNVLSVQHYYVPTVSIDGYQLFRVCVSNTHFMYQYNRTDCEGATTRYDVLGGFEILIPRTPYEGKYPDAITDNERYFTSPRTEDGYVYVERDATLYYPLNGNCAIIRVSNPLNDYDFIKTLCDVRRVTVNPDHVTE